MCGACFSFGLINEIHLNRLKNRLLCFLLKGGAHGIRTYVMYPQIYAKQAYDNRYVFNKARFILKSYAL